MATREKRKPNLILEIIRKEGLRENQEEYVNSKNVDKLEEKCKRIHVGWLFGSNRYEEVLQKLCLYLDGNRDTIRTPGWSAFGNALGITKKTLDVIENGKLGDKGYTYYVLWHYTEMEDPTIGKIIKALWSIKRMDVINETYGHFTKLAEEVLSEGEPQSENEDNPDSGFEESIPEEAEENGAVSMDTEHRISPGVIKPSYIPPPPFLLRFLKGQENRDPGCTFVSEQIEGRVVTETVPLQQRASSQPPRDHHHHLPPSPSSRSPSPAVAVNNEVLKVDYVVPIVTEGFIRAAETIETPTGNDSVYVDCRYVGFIYNLVSNAVLQKKCFLNKEVRCVYPDHLLHLRGKRVMKENVFCCYVKQSSVQNLAERMMARSVRKMYQREWRRVRLPT